MFVGGTGVFVGGTGVFVAGTGVFVGETGVFVGGTGVLVGGGLPASSFVPKSVTQYQLYGEPDTNFRPIPIRV